jgi:hypothetical protein
VIYTFTHDDQDEKMGQGVAKVEVKYEDEGTPLREVLGEVDGGDDNVKEELLEEPGIKEEGVLDVLDQVDGAKEISA